MPGLASMMNIFSQVGKVTLPGMDKHYIFGVSWL